jgi:hypothetical protein
MSSSKIILIGAISVVFGLYNLSLIKINGSAGRSAEIAVYQARATENARSGVQRALNGYNFTYFGVFPSTSGSTVTGSWSYATDSVSSTGTEMSYFTCSAKAVLVGGTYRLSIGSHGFYRSPSEPVTFSGHEVIDTAYAEFPSSYTFLGYNWYYYNVKLKSQYLYVNYDAERKLDVLQTGKTNLLGY